MTRNLLLTLLLLLGLLAPRAHAAQNSILTVAVFDFESKDEAVRNLGPKVATLINANLSAEPQIITVQRADLEKILGEQELGLSGTVAPGAEAKVGNLTGAKVLVTGRVFKVEDELYIVAKVIGTETSLVFGDVVRGKSSTSIGDMSGEMAKKIAAIINQKGDSLVAKVETRDEKIARIKAALAGKSLPSVSVKIGERHFGQPVIDPAAETELSKTLEDCGFTLVDDKSTNQPQVTITGDAFSAYGMRKGNLISCKSRVEVKAHDAQGNVLVADAQTSVGVDITEQTAAKTALENAALDLAERILPKLAR